MNKLSFVITAFLCCWAVAGAKTYQLASPNGKLKVSIENDAKSTAFAITHSETPVLNRSALGMSIEGGKTLVRKSANRRKPQKARNAMRSRSTMASMRWNFVPTTRAWLTVS